MINQASTIIVYTTLFWAIVYVVVNLIPDKWVLDYQDFYAEDVCRDSRQQLVGTRDAITNIKARGVDQLWSYDERRYVDRFEWDGQYNAGVTETGWKAYVTSPPGIYRWDATLLEVEFPFFLKKYIKYVSSNDFVVKDCSEPLDEAVADAFKDYLEIEGYVVE